MSLIKSTLKKKFDRKFSPSSLRNILTKEKNPSKIKELYLKFYKDEGLDTSISLAEIFKDIKTTKQTKEKLAILDKFVREDKTPPDYIESLNKFTDFKWFSNQELDYLNEDTDWVVKLDKIQAPSKVEIEEEEKEDINPKGSTEVEVEASGKTDFDKQFDKEFDDQLQKELEAREKAKAESKPAEKAKAESKPAEKPKPSTDTYPTKEKKQPKKEDDPTMPTITEPLTPREGDRDPPNMADSVPEPEPVPQPIKLTTNKKKDSKVVETEVKTGLEDIPSKIDLIPPERLSSEFKSAKELESDINYFFKTFPKQLENIKKTYSKAKKTPQYLKRTHKRIVAILRAGAKESKEKVGVIIEGSEFIKDKLREIYLEEINKGLTAEDLIMNVEKETAKDKSDIGFYEIKKGASGKEHSQREPIYSKIPEGAEFDPKKEFSKKPARLNTLPTEYRSRFTYENTLYENNPFTKPQSRIQLRKLY